MAQKLEKTGDFTKFDPDWYIENLYGTDEASVNMRPEFDIFHKMFSEYGVRGKRLLDIGTGPSLHSVITPSRYVEEIYLSDYAKRNLEYLEQWLKGENNHPEKNVDYIIKLEGGKMDATERETEVRRKVKGILPIDVTSEQPLGRTNETFDIIQTIYCIGAAVNTVEGYRKCLENITSLLKEGGYLIIAVCLEGASYQVGKYEFEAAYITKEQFENILTPSGYDVIQYFEIPGTAKDAKHMSYKSCYYALATKKSSTSK